MTASKVTQEQREKAKYTPGPWRMALTAAFSDDGTPRVGVWIEAGEYHSLATLMSVPQVKANACLMVASPEMYEALQLILSEPHGCPMCDSGKLRNSANPHFDDCGFARARAAIAKAEGAQ